MLDPRFKTHEASYHKKRPEQNDPRTDDKKSGLMTDREQEELISDDSAIFETDKLSETSSYKSGQHSRNGNRKQSKMYTKNMKLTLNLLYLLLKDTDYTSLEGHESLYSQLVVYMTSEVSLRNMEREGVFVKIALLETQPVQLLAN